MVKEKKFNWAVFIISMMLVALAIIFIYALFGITLLDIIQKGDSLTFLLISGATIIGSLIIEHKYR